MKACRGKVLKICQNSFMDRWIYIHRWRLCSYLRFVYKRSMILAVVAQSNQMSVLHQMEIFDVAIQWSPYWFARISVAHLAFRFWLKSQIQQKLITFTATTQTRYHRTYFIKAYKRLLLLEKKRMHYMKIIGSNKIWTLFAHAVTIIVFDQFISFHTQWD